MSETNNEQPTTKHRLTRRSAIVRRVLRVGGDVGPESVDALEAALEGGQRHRAGDILAQPGVAMPGICVVLAGWTCRWHSTRTGRRVITQFLLPGDVYGSFHGVVTTNQGTLTATTDCEIATLDAAAVAHLRATSGKAAAVLDWSHVCGHALMVEHVRALSAFRASQKVMHLLVSQWRRLVLAGEGFEDGFTLPLTQAQISETSGMSLVHTNKSIAKLREDGLVRFDGQRVRFPDPEMAMAFAEWDDAVLPDFVYRDAA